MTHQGLQIVADAVFDKISRIQMPVATLFVLGMHSRAVWGIVV